MKVHLWFVRAMSGLVPRRWRSEWRKEWEAELQHRESLGRSGLFRRSAGSFWDALAMQPRRLEDEMFQDLRYGMRMLLKNKMLTAAAVLSLAIGIGANTSVFSIANTVLMKKLPARDPHELVIFEWFSADRPMVAFETGRGYRDSTNRSIHTSFSKLTFEAFRLKTQTLSGLAAFQSIASMNVTANGAAETASGQLVSGSFYRTLGVQTVLGRTISEDDDQPDANAVAVLNYGYWQRRFGLDPQVLGKTLTINTVPFTIIGVTVREFSGTEVFESPDIFMPLSTQRQVGPVAFAQWQWWLRLIGRLKPGATAEQVHMELQQVFRDSARESWDASPPRTYSTPPGITFSTPELQVADGSRGDRDNPAALQVFSLLMSVVGLILLIVAANVANLLIARGAARRKEIAIRGVLGASRRRVLRQLLVESVLLASCGGALGIAFAYWGKDFMSWLPGSEAGVLRPELDASVLGFTAVVTVFAGILLGLVPGIYTTRLSPSAAMKNSNRTIAGSRSLLTRSLMVIQLAASLVLVVGAGLFLRTLTKLQHADVGFNVENLAVFTVDPTQNKYSTVQIIDLYERMINRLGAIPGVRSATLSTYPLLSGNRTTTTLRFPGQEASEAGARDSVTLQTIRHNFFDTMEMPLLRGRGLNSNDVQTSSKVAVVNETLARRFFGNDDPIGKRIAFAERDQSIEVVGVVRDAKSEDIGGETTPAVFLPHLQTRIGGMTFDIRTVGSPEPLIPALREAVREIDSNLPVNVKTQSQVISDRLFGQRLFAAFSAFFGTLALLLACMGLYALMSFNVTRRTNEIGIRMALGAHRSEVLGLVMRETLLLVLIGLAIGVLGSFAVTRVLSSTRFGLAAGDIATMIGAALLLSGLALVAGYLPAQRASRLDPMAALRYE